MKARLATIAGATLPLLSLLLPAQPSRADTCTAEDFVARVSGESQCLAMRRFGASEPGAMIVWLHGDVSSGGPAGYHVASAERAAEVLGADKVLSIALLRPGYADADGHASTVAPAQAGRADHYTRENVAEVGAAIERLRAHFEPRRVIVVGHSGGAATTAVLLGMKPGLIDGAVLVSCPCDLGAWRAGRKAWSRSENPARWVGSVAPATRVVALTGDKDDNTSSDLARGYVDALKARQVDAVFRALPNETHNGAFASPAVLEALQELVGGK